MSTTMSRPTPTDLIRIANAGGYWGDDPYALRRQVRGPLPLDYISIDYLAEVTMSILRKQKGRDPAAGFARDFVAQIEPLLEEILDRGIRIVTNAGGVNPQACAEALGAAARRRGLSLRIAVVEGDDLAPRLDRAPGPGRGPAQPGDPGALPAPGRAGAGRQRLFRRHAGGRGPAPRTRTSSSAAGSPTPASPWPPSCTPSAGAPRTMTSWPAASSPGTSWSAAPRPPAATSPTGARSPPSWTWAIPSPSAARTAPSPSPSTPAAGAW